MHIKNINLILIVSIILLCNKAFCQDTLKVADVLNYTFSKKISLQIDQKDVIVFKTRRMFSKKEPQRFYIPFDTLKVGQTINIKIRSSGFLGIGCETQLLSIKYEGKDHILDLFRDLTKPKGQRFIYFWATQWPLIID